MGEKCGKWKITYSHIQKKIPACFKLVICGIISTSVRGVLLYTQSANGIKIIVLKSSNMPFLEATQKRLLLFREVFISAFDSISGKFFY